jgi:flagellar biosynthetic protein FliP
MIPATKTRQANPGLILRGTAPARTHPLILWSHRLVTGLFAFALLGWPARVMAQGMALPKINIGVDATRSPQDVSLSLQVLFLLTILTLAPSLLIMLTSFTRIVIVLSFTRSALGTQQVPPNPILIGLALFLTFFTMAPVLNTVNDRALQPYLHQQLGYQPALQRAEAPIRDFMFKQTREKDLALFVHLSKISRPTGPEQIPTTVLIPAFIISELKTGFIMGFVIFIPFLIIDMVVGVTLMSMGMMMLPPALVSLPLKILLFVMVDGWHLIAHSLVVSFH